MPKSRHRKNQKIRSQNRTNTINSQIKKLQQKQMDEQMKLLSDAEKQREANSEITEPTSTPEGQEYSVSPTKLKKGPKSLFCF